MNIDFVLDTNITVNVLFAPISSPEGIYSRRVINHLEKYKAAVPLLLEHEMLSTTMNLNRDPKAKVSDKQLAGWLGRFDRLINTQQLVVVHERIPPCGLADAYQRLVRHPTSGYDGCFLYLARDRGVPIATLDGQLLRAAVNDGVPVLFADNNPVLKALGL
ncbi:MAG TPA: type II toxin-antitoxin system VapC family toxin [Armatimonadota bacterium]